MDGRLLACGQRGVCPPDAVLDPTAAASAPRTAEYQPAQGVPQARHQLPPAAPAPPGLTRTAHPFRGHRRGQRGPAGDPRWGLRQMRAPLSGRDAAWVTYSPPPGIQERMHMSVPATRAPVVLEPASQAFVEAT